MRSLRLSDNCFTLLKLSLLDCGGRIVDTIADIHKYYSYMLHETS